MSKTIDVRPGDTWTVDSRGLIWQYRNNQCRVVDVQKLCEWVPDKQLPNEQSITSDAAHAIVMGWGYTITPAAKPEAKPEIIHCHSPIENMLVTAAEAKPADVVDAVWVLTTWESGDRQLEPFATPFDANRVCGNQLAKGTAHIVRIRSVDEEARKRLDEAEKVLKDHAVAIFLANNRITALESRLAAVEAIANCKSIVIPAEKPADKDAARVVKVPKNEQILGTPGHSFFTARDRDWLTALFHAGITVEAAE